VPFHCHNKKQDIVKIPTTRAAMTYADFQAYSPPAQVKASYTDQQSRRERDRGHTIINVDPAKAKKTPKKSIAAILLRISVTSSTSEARLTVSNYHTPS
jgi:hypothetical protein